MHLGLFKKAFVNVYLANTESSNETLSEAIVPYIENLNAGWVGTGNGVWTPENPTNSYSDIYSVLGGHKYFLTLGETVGTRFRVMFSSVDVSTASSAVSGTAVNTSNYNNPAPYQNLYYTPNSDGYIIVQKDNIGNSGIKTFLHECLYPLTCVLLGEVDFDNFDKDKVLNIIDKYKTCLNSSFQLHSVKFVQGYVFGHTDWVALSVTQLPLKTKYRVGDIADYTGVAVTATYENGSTFDVTDKAIFCPAHGEAISSPVSVSFKGLYTSFNLNVTGVALTQLSVTPPLKTVYLHGETLDLTGCTVTALYADGSTKDVTSSAVFSPPHGTVLSKNDGDANNEILISVSYSEPIYQDGVSVGTDTLTDNFAIKVTYLERIILTKPTRISYYLGDTLDYSGLKVEAVYKNADTLDVTDKAVITPSEGTVITSSIITGPVITGNGSNRYNLNVNISYTDSVGDSKTDYIVLGVPHIEITLPTKMYYHVGEALDFTGFAEKIDGVDVTSSIETEAPKGTTISNGDIVPSSWRDPRGWTNRPYIYCYYTDALGNREEYYFYIHVYYD